MLLYHSASSMQEETMRSKPFWQIRRNGVAQGNGSQQWDDAYQLLLRWATASEAGPPLPPVPIPGSV